MQGGLGSTPGQGTRSHVLHLRVYILQLEILRDAGKDWGQEEKGRTEDAMARWHHQHNGHESEQTPGDSKGQEAWHAAVHGIAKSQSWLHD